MPSQEPSIQDKGFRTSMFGGFDKNDVLAYMNALANETQQRELELQQTIDELNERLDTCKKDQTSARIYTEQLQKELNQANQRAEKAEKASAEAKAKLEDAQDQLKTLQGKFKECQQAGRAWQFRCHDLEKQVKEMEDMIPKGGMPAPRQPEPEAPPKPREQPAPEPPAPVAPSPVAPASVPPAPAGSVTEQARVEARKILADARLTAESAERRLREQEEAQKARMAEHATALEAGVLLLRDRLARVDERLNSASMDLENATGAIYQALDDTKQDLDSLGADLRSFGQGDLPEPAAHADPAALRAKVAPRRVRPVRQPAPPAPVKRLRRAARGQRPVSQELGEALDRLDK